MQKKLGHDYSQDKTFIRYTTGKLRKRGKEEPK